MDFLKEHRKFIVELQNTLRSDQSALSSIPGNFSTSHMLSNEKFIFEIGVYGIPDQHSAKEVVQDLAHLTYKLNGHKMFYCSSFLTPEQFWKAYRKQEPVYLELRKKYTAQYIPDITQKVLYR